MYLLFCIFFICNLLFSYEEENNYFINNIDNNFIGYYVSIDFLTSIEKYRSYAIARGFISENTYYAHIIVYDNNMIVYPFYSDTFFEISVELFTEFNFVIINDEMIIIDPNGNRYKKMTNSVEYEAYYRVMENYIGNIVLIDFIKNGEIIIEDDYIFVPSFDNKKYGISTWLMYGNDANLAIYDENNNWVYIDINNNELIIYRIQRNMKIILWKIKI